MNIVTNNIIDQLKRDEGFRSTPYIDSRGFQTIGYGHNLVANPMQGMISLGEAEATALLGRDVERISAFLQQKLPWVVNLDDARYGVLQNMAFNMGVPGLLDFHHDLSDTQAGRYVQSATDMKNSAWYTQVGERAQRLVKQMLSGEWQ